MSEKELRDLLTQRLHIELLLFKDSMLQKKKEDIFMASYKIEVYVDLYEIFVEHVKFLKEDTIRGLLKLNHGILESICQEWISWKAGLYDELSAYVCDKLELISEIGRTGNHSGKEEKNGTEFDQVA